MDYGERRDVESRGRTVLRSEFCRQMYRNHRFSSSWILDGMMRDQHFSRRPEVRGKTGLPE